MVCVQGPGDARRGAARALLLGQASCLQKLVEGELCVDRPEPLPGNVVPWDPDPYRMCNGAAVVEYKGDRMEEPIRSREWRLANLWHEKGRMRI